MSKADQTIATDTEMTVAQESHFIGGRLVRAFGV